MCAAFSALFQSLGISPWLCGALGSLGIRTPTAIQVAALPPILAGRDLIGKAKTGSGKTAAFALPILQQLAKDPFGIFALVLTPTRELAFQLAEQFRALGTEINLRDVVVIGGLGRADSSDGNDCVRAAVRTAARSFTCLHTVARLN